MKEELTTKMHSEFTITDEEDIEIRAWTAESTIKDGLFTVEEACRRYGITLDQYNKYNGSWRD